jgi:hypothetical protein
MLRSATLAVAATLAVGAGLLGAAPSDPAPATITRSAAQTSARVSVGQLIEQVPHRDLVGEVAAATTGSRTVSTLRGSSSAYRFLAVDNGKPAHWNRCRTIRYRVNPSGIPSGALADVKEAVRRLSAASGLRFSYAGTTTVVPYSNSRWSRIPSGQAADIFLAFSTAAKVSGLRGSVAGMGGPLYQRTSREPRIVLGGVVIDRATSLHPGFAAGASRGTLLLHELGHAINLGHVSDGYQVMYPSLSSRSRGDYQRGDRAGLTKLRSYGCF